MEANRKEASALRKIVAVISILAGLSVVLLAILQIFDVWTRAINLCVPMMGVTMLCQAYTQWNSSRKVAWFSIGVSAFIFVCAAVVLLSSCGVGMVKIEEYEWKMKAVMINDAELAQSGELVVAVGEADSAHPNAKIVDITLIAKDGKLTISDLTNDKIYEGSYEVSGKNPEGVDYEVTVDGKAGYATVAMTKYYDGTEEPTLPINLGDYSLYFYEK